MRFQKEDINDEVSNKYACMLYHTYRVNSHELQNDPHLRVIEYLKLVNENLNPSADLSVGNEGKRELHLPILLMTLQRIVTRHCATTKMVLESASTMQHIEDLNIYWVYGLTTGAS